MAQRLELHDVLKAILGSENVYFKEPPTVQMQYPCIVYRRSGIDIKHADNKPYSHAISYQVTVITDDPDDETHLKVGMLPTARYDRNYTADKLNHDVYNLFF